ncbi:methyltransferase family protein [Archaeoglobus sp.]
MRLFKLSIIGLISILFGLLLIVLACKERRKFEFTACGIYAIVRHPEFLGRMLIIFGLMISRNILSILVCAILIAMLYLGILSEEKENLKKFGKNYEEYMERVPRLNILEGVRRKCKYKEQTL